MPRWKPGSLRPIWEKVCNPTHPRSAAVLRDPAAFWQLFGSYEGEPIRFDPWQIAHLRDYSRYRAREKAPQIGFSWLCALEALWDCLLHMDATSGVVSVDQREAGEKILYARKAYAELPADVQRWVPLVKDSSEELWFGDTARPSRLMSVPATSALRGRKMSVYLDEVDFYRDGGVDAHRVAMGRVARGGRVTMGSTCFGQDTQLDKTMQSGKNFSKARFPHTVAENPDVIESVAIARDELDPADFAEEYECLRGGGLSDTFGPELIRRSQHGFELRPLDDLPADSGRWQIAGYDASAGTGRHPALLSIIESTDREKWDQIVIEEIRDLTLPQQEQLLREMLDKHRRMTLAIDANGVGRQAAQALEARFPDRVISVVPGAKPDGMPPQDRAEMTLALKRALESDRLKLAVHKDQAQQFRRTKIKRGTGGRVLVDQPGAKHRTHYDCYWATAYAWYGALAGATESIYERRGLIVIGGSR